MYWPTGDDPAYWNYWRRESLAYAEGLPATAYGSAGVRGPELLETNIRDDGMIELWLDFVPGAEGFSWPVDPIAQFAYRLGAGQARWVGRVPELPWLSRGWLRQYLMEGPAPSVEIKDSDWDHPGIAVWPASVREGAACGAAKCSWYGPAVLSRAVKNDVASSNYSKDGSVEATLNRVSGMVALIAGWAETATA